MLKPEVYTKSEIAKLGNTLVFLIEKLSPFTTVSKTHLLKLIYIIEEISIKKFGIPFFNLRFNVWKLGPVSKDLYVELTEEPNLLANYIGLKDISGKNFAEVFAKTSFSDDEFSDKELALLEEISDRFKYCTAKELINFTHRPNTPWYNAAQKNGLLEVLELGQINTTDIEIDLSEVIRDEDEKLAFYKLHIEVLEQSRSLKG